MADSDVMVNKISKIDAFGDGEGMPIVSGDGAHVCS